MRIVSAISHAFSPDQAMAELGSALLTDGHDGCSPDFVVLYGITALVDDRLHGAACQRFGTAALHGGTSSTGVLGTGWSGSGSLPSIGAFAIFDPDGSYGTASGDLGLDPAFAAARLMETALQRANRPGEAPDLIMLTTAPGTEGEVMRGIRSVVGVGTPIVGGSSSANDSQNDWLQFSGDGLHRNGLVISALFPSARIGHSYQTGFVPSGPSGIVTAVDGRRILSIDDQPAADVYADWSGGVFQPPSATDAAMCVMKQSSLQPLGRVKGALNGVPSHLLLLPVSAWPDGGLGVLADIDVGERLWQMQGSIDNLIAHAGRVARHAASGHQQVSGGLLFCCAGCVITVKDRVNEVAAQIESVLGDAPYLAVFSYGEQGTLPDGQSEHGNLMFSCAVFGSDPDTC